MAQARKFGAFSGVFTPSILTILGVIMYLRLPSIVGQAGLLQAFAIIAVAHIISVATGLSVSSIATDKRVRAGGTYYIISRSLGLPMGGTLGLALFAGLSLSVSMYLVGFSESFLGYWGLPVNAGTIRLTGSIMLAVVTTVTLISTALALKTQYYIMAAIGLSLLSIILGRHDMAPTVSQIQPLADAAPFIVLFGIFFPAVTGFEAGVSMSGDLKDPKRAIPGGTIAAIVVGLTVYLALAAFLSYTVDRQQLANNPNVLLEMSIFPPLVVAGIWGATISSAFGSILGAPRILQATAADGITPRWFARGYGKENEPRHALVLAFIIAWAGILIGELDVIARVVSMFFITTYGFLNLTATIESWVSPDFRPEFRVPRFVAIIGAIACFVVMIQLDFLAMLGASVILGGLYVFLTRRQLRLETGDTWEGVWSSVARSALLRLNAGLGHRRNWRPNVLLFSGGTAARPHLTEFAMQLAGSRGLVTNFQLVEEGAPDPGPMEAAGPGTPDVATPREAPWGVFARRVECPDVYTGVAEIADHYGFVGIEPNTVIMGWARNSRDPERFAALLQHLADRDLNILLLDFDRDRGWGRRQRIDVWWRLTGSDVSFSLALIRFLGNADAWQDVKVRFLTVNDYDAAWNASILRDMTQVLDEQRVEAEVRVIDNQIEKRPFSEIIRGESIDADLTVLGLSDMREGDAARFVSDMNSVVDVLGTVVLARASSYFSEPLVRASAALGAAPVQDQDQELEPERTTEPAAFPEDIEIAAPESVLEIARPLDQDLRSDVRSARDEYVHRIFAADRAFLGEIGGLATGILTDLAKQEERGGTLDAEAMAGPRDELVRTAFERMERERTEGIATRGALLTGFGHRLAVAVAARRHHAPEWLDVLPEEDGSGEAPAPRGWLFGREPGHRSQSRLLLEAHLQAFAARMYGEMLETVSADAVRTATLTQRWIETTLSACAAIENVRSSGGSAAVRASIQAEALRNEMADALRQSNDNEARLVQALESRAVAAIVAFVQDAASPETRRVERQARETQAAAQAETTRIDAAVDALPGALRLLLNGAETGIRLALARDRVRREGALTRSELRAAILEPTVDRLDRVSHVLNQVRGSLDAEAEAEIEAATHYHAVAEAEAVLAGTRERIASLAAELPASVELVTAETDAALAEGRPEDVEAAALPVRGVFEYLGRTEVFAPLLDEVVRALDAVESAAEVCREVAQLAAFELRAPDKSARVVAGKAGSEVIVRSGTERIERELRGLQELGESLDETVRRRFEGFVTRLDPFSLARVAGRLPQYMRSERGRGLVGGLAQLRLRTGRALAERATQLAYRRSEGVLLARRLEREGSVTGGPGFRIRRWVTSVSPRPAVVEKLPTFYRQLFLGGATVSDNPVGFEAEMADAEAAVQAHRHGAGGALFIVAEQGHGRATFSRLLTQRTFPRGAIFRVDPVEGGSVDPRVFERRLALSLRMARDDAAAMISRLPAGSTLVINDLGLWWERSQDGSAVLDLICGLIERFGNRCLFVINANIRAFHLMNRVRPMDDRMLALIEIEPFHARELKELVLLRHGAGGLGFTIDGQPEDSLSDWKLARFFDALFDYSSGNIGAALNTWVASIREVEDETVHLMTPKRPKLDAFSELGPIQRMIAVQLVVHDRATLDRLVRIARLDHAVLARELRALQSSGLVVRSAGGAIQIDRFARPHFVRFLTQEGLL